MGMVFRKFSGPCAERTIGASGRPLRIYCSRQLHDGTGSGNLYRVRKGCGLSELPVKLAENGGTSGFRDEFYFSRLFREKFQLSPLKYRREFPSRRRSWGDGFDDGMECSSSVTAELSRGSGLAGERGRWNRVAIRSPFCFNSETCRAVPMEKRSPGIPPQLLLPESLPSIGLSGTQPSFFWKKFFHTLDNQRRF